MDVALARTLLGFSLLALVVAGVGGTIYKLMAPDGWLVSAFGRSVSGGLALISGITVVVVLVSLSRGWAIRERNRRADLFVYAFALTGLLYLGQMLVNGRF